MDKLMKHYNSNISVNLNELAFNLYQLIKECPDSACITLGMFPAKIMTSFERVLKHKIPDKYLDSKTLEEVDGKSIRQEIEHDVCCKILELATNDETCIV